MHPSNPHRHNPNSVVLTDSKAKAIPIFGAVWTVLALSGMGLLLIGSFVLATILFVAAIGSAFWLLPRAVSFLHWHPAEVIVPTNTFALGATETIVYHRRPRKISDIAETQVQLTLECVETARYQVGTNSRTETSTVFQHTFTASGRGSLNGFEAPILLQIPTNAGGPTLNLSNNKVAWRMKIQTDPASTLPTHKATFPLVVGPVLSPPEIQDAPRPTSNRTPQDGTGY